MENKPDETLREVKKNIRLQDWRPRRDSILEGYKDYALVEELKWIVRHDLVLRESCISKSSLCVGKAAEKKRLQLETEIRRHLMHR